MFYKFIKDELVCGNYIYGQGYILTPADKTVKIDGWEWFDTDEQAKIINVNTELVEPKVLNSNFYRMFGLGIILIPHKSGDFRLSISFNPSGVGSELNYYKVAHGLGSSPIHGSIAIGTVDNEIYSGSPVSKESIIIAKNIFIKYPCWLDLQGAKNKSNTSIGIKNLKVNIQEI
jgi:hypothetical protein